ncbi:phosphonate metabolism protein/1,5-bisphosphokinase (PRPP-forming) PhnN [Aquibium sp. LZ166]|uniref:Ribose 1,5-bisphosphate phosphokinase PhnN n=1 Tax=Aquibium pacificus TaxID=3153579 RepID=A0ABV3SF70_9HYPH
MERPASRGRNGLDARERQGAFVAVVGPSGAGKDTLIGYAKARLAEKGRGRFHFVRRVITRAADGSTEDHDTLSPMAFERAEADGAFALSWEAHGLRYGLPESVDRHISAGDTVVANLSRKAIPALRTRYRNVSVVAVVASNATLSARLMARGRESAEEVAARLSRSTEPSLGVSGAFATIANDGSIEDAGEALISAISAAAELSMAPLDL